MITSVTPSELEQRRQRGETVDLIDVRTPAEFESLHVEFARSVPLDGLEPQDIERGRIENTQAPLYIICQRGHRAEQAREMFVTAGYANVEVVAGGTVACEAAGLPMVRGRGAMSMERQVRIAAGALVLVGLALAQFLHPYFVAVPAVIGAGLIFSGATDTCGMASVLARLPWNRATSPGNSCSRISNTSATPTL